MLDSQTPDSLSFIATPSDSTHLKPSDGSSGESERVSEKPSARSMRSLLDEARTHQETKKTQLLTPPSQSATLTQERVCEQCGNPVTPGMTHFPWIKDGKYERCIEGVVTDASPITHRWTADEIEREIQETKRSFTHTQPLTFAQWCSNQHTAATRIEGPHSQGDESELVNHWRNEAQSMARAADAWRITAITLGLALAITLGIMLSRG